MTIIINQEFRILYIYVMFKKVDGKIKESL
jgi:hypothetical protein